MAEEEQKHHQLFHHKNEEEGPVDYEKKEKNHKHGEEISGVSALAGGGYALHEKHQAKKDPENAHSHKTKAEIAAVAGRSCAGLAIDERHRKKNAKHHQ